MVYQKAFPYKNLSLFLRYLQNGEVLPRKPHRFNQIKLADESKEMTGFVILNKVYQYKRIPFGIKSGPKIFQSIIQKILEGLEGCFIYIDDIVIYGIDDEDHDDKLYEVLKRLYDEGVKLNFKKCDIRKKEIILLGYKISYDKLEIIKENLRSDIISLHPKNKKQIQRIVGYFNWYRKFIPNLSEKISPITELLKKEKFSWSENESNIVKGIFIEVKEATSLRFPNFHEEFHLECDASEKGIAGCLYQSSGILGYYSKKLNETENRYSIVEKELYAILLSLEHFKHFLQGYKVIIHIDSRNIIFPNARVIKRVERWKTLINAYNFQIEHISGKNNTIADLLSRQFLVKEKRSNDLSYEMKNMSSKENLRENFNNYLIKKQIIRKDYSMKEGKEILQDQEEIRLLIKFFHKKYGHSGVTNTVKTLEKYYCVSGLRKITDEYISNCNKCMKCKHKYGEIKFKNKIDGIEPFRTLCSDILGPIKGSKFKGLKNGKKYYLLTITDVFSRFTEVYVLKNINSSTITKKFTRFFKKFKHPKNLITDNGKQFISKELKKLLTKRNVKHSLVPTYTPSSNGISERINRSLNEVLRIYKGKRITKVLNICKKRLNCTYNHGIKNIPLKVLKKGKNDNLPKEDPKENNMNIGRINQGDMVFIREFKNKEKEDDLYTGPYRVTEVGKKGSWIRVGNGTDWYHIKNIKKKRGAECNDINF